jgi:hypothetical protein
MAGKIQVAAIGSAPASQDEFQIYTAKPDVRFLSRAVQPPSQVYVSVGDDIVVGCASSQAGETVTVSYRLLRFDGELVLGQFAVHPNSDRSLAVYHESLAEGFLLSVSCKAAVATTRGQTFVRVFLTDPALGQGQPSYMLMADYVTTAMAPAHPNGRVLTPVEGPGAIVGYSFGNPPPGGVFTISVPTNARWRPISVYAKLTTDATAGNRFVEARLITNLLLVWTANAYQGIPPSTVCDFAMAPISANSAISTTRANAPIPPDARMLGGDSIGVGTAGAGAADQWSQVEIAVEEWIDNG